MSFLGLVGKFGDSLPDGVGYVPSRRPDAPIRLATVVPEDRQHHLRASFACWEIEFLKA